MGGGAKAWETHKDKWGYTLVVRGIRCPVNAAHRGYNESLGGWLGQAVQRMAGQQLRIQHRQQDISAKKIMGRRLQGRKLYRLDEENASFNGYCTGGGWELKMFCACGFCV